MWLFLLQTNEEDGDQNEEEDGQHGYDFVASTFASTFTSVMTVVSLAFPAVLVWMLSLSINTPCFYGH